MGTELTAIEQQAQKDALIAIPDGPDTYLHPVGGWMKIDRSKERKGYAAALVAERSQQPPVYAMSRDYEALYDHLVKGGEALGIRTSSKTGTVKRAPILLRLCADGGFDFQQGWEPTGKQYTKSQFIAECTRLQLEWLAPSPQAVTVDGKWISVDDRLPEMVATAREVWQSDYVLVFTDRPVDHQYRIVRAFLCKVGDKVPTWKSSGLGGAVTHWMPLPSAPASTNT